jgi:hypothetical protein
MAEQQGRPLWVAMDNASWNRMKQGPYAPQDIRAAELRAIADVVVPESPPPEDHANATDWHVWSATHEIRALLLAEAERAERAG